MRGSPTFEIVTTPLALVIALVIVNVVQPGAGINADPATLDASAVSAYASSAQDLTVVEFLMNVIPSTVVDAFARPCTRSGWQARPVAQSGSA